MQNTISQPICYFEPQMAKYNKTDGTSALDLYEQPKIMTTEKVVQKQIGVVPTTRTRTFDVSSRDIILVGTSSTFAVKTGTITNGFNEQTTKYINTVQNEQEVLNEQTQQFLKKQAEAGVARTATNLRNKGNWTNVKRLVVREELMKLQIGDTTELPLSDSDLAELKAAIKDKDLSNMSDKELQNLIDGILKTDPQQALNALKEFKKNGTVSPYFQESKLQALADELKDIDLDKITAKQLKHILDNYWEKLNVHHRTSISYDETKQSDIDNLDTVSTSDHAKKHTHTDENTGEEKVDYPKPVNEEPRDRKAELKELNKKRVIKNELKGLGVTLLIAGGVGFSIGFAVQLAQSGINPKTMKYAFASGAESGADSMVVASGSYILSRTIGMKASEALFSAFIEEFGDFIPGAALANISNAATLGISGSLGIMVSVVYQFCKLKIKGFSTKECLLRVGNSASLSFAILTLSVVAQGVVGGCAGMVVSITAGVIMTSVQIATVVHDKTIRQKVSIYLVRLCEPDFENMRNLALQF